MLTMDFKQYKFQMYCLKHMLFKDFTAVLETELPSGITIMLNTVIFFTFWTQNNN